MAVLAGAVPAVKEGAEQSYVAAKEFYRYSAEVLTRETVEFDVEKVFMQSIYGCAIFAVAKVAYHIYFAGKQASFIATETNGGYDPIYFMPFFGDIVRLIRGAIDAGQVNEDWAAKWEAEMESDPIVKYGNPIFVEYFFFVLLAIPGLLLLMEYRRVRKLRRKARLVRKAYGL